MKGISKRILAEIRTDMEKQECKARKKNCMAPIYRGMRGGCGAPASDEVSVALEQMIGATILDAGFIETCHEGGLALDFVKDGRKMRLVLGYNDLGEWIGFFGDKNEK